MTRSDIPVFARIASARSFLSLPFSPSSYFTAAPASTCFRNPMICSSVNLDFFMPELSLGNRTLLTFPWC